MAGYSVKLPLSRDNLDGFSLNKTLNDVLRQNLKHVVLTIPGERMMNPNFGAGIIRYLFENVSPGLQQQVEADILKQVELYVPSVEILDIVFSLSDEPLANTLMSIAIHYSTPIGQEVQVLTIPALGEQVI